MPGTSRQFRQAVRPASRLIIEQPPCRGCADPPNLGFHAAPSTAAHYERSSAPAAPGVSPGCSAAASALARGGGAERPQRRLEARGARSRSVKNARNSPDGRGAEVSRPTPRVRAGSSSRSAASSPARASVITGVFSRGSAVRCPGEVLPQQGRTGPAWRRERRLSRSVRAAQAQGAPEPDSASRCRQQRHC